VLVLAEREADQMGRVLPSFEAGCRALLGIGAVSSCRSAPPGR
jgi:hypothetical protein